MNLNYTRGSVYWAYLNSYEHSSVQRGSRPVIIVSSLVGSYTSDVVMIVPITTKNKKLSVNAELDFKISDKTQTALCNQIQVIPKNQLGSYAGQLSKEDLNSVDEKILIALGLSKAYVEKTNTKLHKDNELRNNKEALDKLIPQAKEIIKQLSELVLSARASNKTGDLGKNNGTKRRRSSEEIKEFMDAWSDPMSVKRDVADVFGFPTYSAAYQFYTFHKKKEQKNG